MFVAFGGCLRAPVSPHVLWFRHVNQAGLRLFWAGIRLYERPPRSALGCEGGR